MAAKTRVQVRVDPELLAWADGYAKLRGSTRTDILDAALREFREACGGGVPDVPVPARPRAVSPQVAPKRVVGRRAVREDASAEFKRLMAERQRRLNEGRG